MKLRILQRAFRDLDAIHEFIAQNNPVAADLLITTVLATIGDVGNRPFSGPEVSFKPAEKYRGLRYRVVTGYPNYLVFYQIQNDTVRIVRVLHGARHLTRLFHTKEQD